MTVLTRRTRRGLLPFLLTGLAVLLGGCGDQPGSPTVPTMVSEAKGGVKGPNDGTAGGGGDDGGSQDGEDIGVTDADPSYGNQGTLALEVVITGSGFDETAEAVWERDGQADPKVSTRSTEFVSPTELKATIDIALDADIDLYDVAVFVGSGGNRKKGVGVQLFQVTKAESMGEKATLNGATVVDGELWAVGGQNPHPVLWTPSTGFRALDTGDRTGQATAIDGEGRTITGVLDGAPWVWERDGETWTLEPLPLQGSGGYAWDVGSESGTGILRVAGRQDVPSGGNRTQGYPALWVRSGGQWLPPILLPTDGEGSATGVANDGVAVAGNSIAADRAVIWTRTSTADGYEREVLELPAAYRASRARGISPDGDLVVGRVWTRKGNTELPAYWEQDGSGQWSLHVLPGVSCGMAMAASAGRTIVGRSCEHGATLWNLGSGRAEPLLGLDVGGERPVAYGITPDGAYAVGLAGSGGELLAVFWRLLDDVVTP